MYVVIYMWQGERHVHSRCFDKAQVAARLVHEMRADGWRCWMELR